jgi:exosortase/archaeosortase family protein
MLKSYPSGNANRYLIKIALVYLSWKLIHAFVLHGSGPVALIWLNLTHRFGTFYAMLTTGLLNLISEPSIQYGWVVMNAKSHKTVAVVEHCLAIPASIMFAALIYFAPGTWLNKLWFIISGVLIIFCINLIRLVLLCLAFEYLPASVFMIHHSLIYVIATYGLIMLMIFLWFKKYSQLKTGLQV